MPPVAGRGKQGVDDFLVAHGKQAFSALIDAARDASGVNVIGADTVSPEPVEWLWRNRIPFGALTLLDGDPGMGKSTLVCDLAARLTTRRAMPGESRSAQQASGSVLILSAEDDPSRTIRPRLEAAGTNLRRVALLTHAHDVDGPRPISLPGDIHYIEQEISRRVARLVIIDPFMAYIDAKVDTNSDASARRVLHCLAELGRTTGAAFVLLRHLNKRPGTAAIYRGGGSIAFTAACRSCLVVGKDQKDDRTRIVASVKCNLGPPPKAITFSIAPAKTKNAETSRVTWGSETDATADDILDNQPKGKVDACVAVIKSVLHDKGPMPSAELNKLAADKTGAHDRTIKEARQRAKVKVGKEPGKLTKWWSRLPDQEFTWEKDSRLAAAKWAKQV